MTGKDAQEIKEQKELDLMFSERPVKQRKFLHIHKFIQVARDEGITYYECESCPAHKVEHTR